MSPEYREIPVDKIRLSPFNTRGEVPAEELESLAATMRESHGNDVPIKVRPVEGDQPYELVYGERRLRALRIAGLEFARCVVQEMTDAEVLMEQWVENEEHRDIPDYGKALKLKQIMDATGLNQAGLAHTLGKSQPWISVHLGMLKLEPFITRVIIWQLSEKQARAILAAPEELLQELCAVIERIYKAEKRIPSASEIAVFIEDLKYEHEEAERAESTPHEHVADESGAKCRICGRPLSDPESVKREMGPVCAEAKPERFPGENAISQALGQTPKPTKLDRARNVVKRYLEMSPGAVIEANNMGRIIAYQLSLTKDEGVDLAKQLIKEDAQPKPEAEPEQEQPTEDDEPYIELTVDILVTDKDGAEKAESVATRVPYGGKLRILVDGTEVHHEDAPEEVT